LETLHHRAGFKAEAAKAFVSYLLSPTAVAVIEAKGMNPG
jgi:ABC-type Fe3+ transport system substrate-binding protein